MSDQDMARPAGPGSHASHEASKLSSPSGFDPSRIHFLIDALEGIVAKRDRGFSGPRTADQMAGIARSGLKHFRNEGGFNA